MNYHRSKSEQNLFGKLTNQYLPFWPLFIGLFALSTAGCYLYLNYYATPQYKASATIIIKDESKGVDNSEIMESINTLDSKKIVENEIEVIRSRELMRAVVDQLHLYAPISEDHHFKGRSAYAISPVLVQVKDPDRIPVDMASQKFYFSYDSKKNEVSLEGKKHPVDQWVQLPKFGELKFVVNPLGADSAERDLYFNLVNPKLAAGMLLEQLEVSPTSKLSSVVALEFQDPVPQRAEDVLNHLIDSYNQSAVSQRNVLANNTLHFVEERMKKVENELNTLELEIQQYKTSKGVVDLGEQSKQYLQNVGDNDRKIADYSLQLAVLDKVESYVLTRESNGSIVPATLGIDDPVLSQLLEKLYDSEIQYEKLKRTTAENNPLLVSIADEIEKIRPHVLENVQNQKINLQASLNSLSSNSGRYTNALQTIPQKERELLEINRRKASKEELFSFLLQKREETALSYGPGIGDTRVVDKAQATFLPISPIPVVMYLIALIVAAGLGVVYISGRELLNRNILFRTEIEKGTNIPVIGELSYIKKAKRRSPGNTIYDLVSEEFRDLRLSLGLYGSSRDNRKLLVTSSIEGEGKSFVSKNLALSLALSGKSVLLLNFDLLKESKSDLFGDAGQAGISEYLQGTHRLEEIIQPTGTNKLFVIPSGDISGSTSSKLLDVDLSPLFAQLDELFDFVIIDTPPVNISLHAFLLSKYCDTTLYIMRHSYTPKAVLQYVDENPKIKTFKNPYLIFNGVKNRGLVQAGYGSGYGRKMQKPANYMVIN